MVSRTRSLLPILLVIAMGVMSPAVLLAQAPSGPTIVTINGNPLKINVAADASFQIINSAVVGRGQIFPTGSNYGDAGVFADINGTLFAPAFSQHGGTATGGLGSTTAWQSVSISQVQGDGAASSPFTVTVNVAASGMGVSMSMVVTYGLVIVLFSALHHLRDRCRVVSD